MNVETYGLFAKLLAYPSDATKSALETCRSALTGEPAIALSGFVDKVAPLTTEELQELYVRTLDLNPTCSLEVGWQLYGENYSRGEFLVAMRQTLRRLGVEESTELPDHLTHALAAFGRMEASEATGFAAEFLLPALEKMRQGLNGPYADLLAAIQALIGATYPTAQTREEQRKSSWSLPVIDPSPEVCHG